MSNVLTVVIHSWLFVSQGSGQSKSKRAHSKNVNKDYIQRNIEVSVKSYTYRFEDYLSNQLSKKTRMYHLK